MDELRNLDWCLHSQPLMAESETWPSADWFAALPVGSHVPEVSARRLGIRFEQLIQGWLVHADGMTLLAHNLPVHDGTRTIGEFDVLVECQGHIEHWELACKFYLGTVDVKDMSRWYGPDPADTLATKVSRLVSHQLALSSHPAAQNLLTAHGWQIEKKRAFVKGRLFHPLAVFDSGQITVPDSVNPLHERGWWISVNAFIEDASFAGQHFLRLQKPRWLAPVGSAPLEMLEDHAQLSAWLEAEQPFTAHIAVINQEGNEISRGFLVSDAWLKKAGVSN